jgi:YbbR domain-containing protein
MSYNPFGHLGLKVISLTIAILLWLAVAGNQIVERGLRVPLEIQNLPEKLELVDQLPEFVDVRVRGDSSKLASLGPGDVVAVIDVHSAKTGRRLFNLVPEQVRAPFGIEVSQVVPPTLTLSFEPAGVKELPVVPAVEGEPAPGYVAGKITSSPATVEAIGPQTALARVTEAITEPVSIEGATADRLEQVTIGLPDESLRLRNPASARVAVQITPAPVERSIRGTPVHIKNVAARLSAQAVPAIVNVRARGSEEAFRDLAADSVMAYVDVAGLGPGRYDLPVRVEPTKGFGIDSIDPATVTITIR